MDSELYQKIKEASEAPAHSEGWSPVVVSTGKGQYSWHYRPLGSVQQGDRISEIAGERVNAVVEAVVPPKITRTIAGYELTLHRGRYLATRPMGPQPGRLVTVTIQTWQDGDRGRTVAKLCNMTLDKANDFLEEFNDGPSTFDGREW